MVIRNNELDSTIVTWIITKNIVTLINLFGLQCSLGLIAIDTEKQ